MNKLLCFFKKPIVLIVISALFSALPFSLPSLWFLAFFSFVPLFFVLVKCVNDKSCSYILKSFLFGFLFYVGIYYWFLWMHPLEYAGLTGPKSVGVTFLAWFGISLVHGALWCIPAILCKISNRFIKSPIFLIFVGIFGIIAAQKLTGIGELAFPFVRISLSLYKVPMLLQAASLFGVDGTDILILLINGLLTLVLIYPPRKKQIVALCALALFIINLLFGAIRMNSYKGKEKIKIMSVQGNVGTEEKWAGDSIDECYDAYTSITNKHLDKDIDLVVWPESAVPVNLSDYPLYADMYKMYTKENNVPILIGCLWRKDGKKANSATIFFGDTVSKSYVKRKPVPFGEYMPYRRVLSNLFPSLNNINVLGSDYIKGDDTAIMKTPKGNIGNVICLEITHPDLTRESVRDGAELMVAVTNDSWLKDSIGTSQHAAHTVLRSIESSRCFVRCANTGVSVTVDSRGRILSHLPALKEGVIKEELYFSEETTLYMLVGDILFPLYALLLLIFGIVLIRKGPAE